ncbi:transposase [Methylobacterium sp. Leaf112]|uniref:transposase n=1 Tax=Methylobacterium sp. Leaf112 TaxID=1736258 RepID=UPI003FCDEC7A
MGGPTSDASRDVPEGHIARHLRTGGARRGLPAGFPPWRTVYGWFRRWTDKGLFEALMRALARRQRRRCGRRPEPRPAIVDTQSVKCLGVRGRRGYDGAKSGAKSGGQESGATGTPCAIASSRSSRTRRASSCGSGAGWSSAASAG